MNASNSELAEALAYYDRASKWYYSEGPGKDESTNDDDYYPDVWVDDGTGSAINTKKRTDAELALPYHMRTRECTDQEAWAARERWLNDRVSPDIEPGKPFVTKDPNTHHEIVIYRESADSELVYEEYNELKEY